MIVLDTNVISELARQAPDAGVIEWLDALDSSELSTTAVAVAELLYGVARLPEGRCRIMLASMVRSVIRDDLGNRVLSFDEGAAEEYTDVVTHRERLGRPVGVADAQIAAICRAEHATLATRNTKDFEETGVELVDPWQIVRDHG